MLWVPLWCTPSQAPVAVGASPSDGAPQARLLGLGLDPSCASLRSFHVESALKSPTC